ncbi:MAG TPA: hypothetical protein DHW82_10595 [Spirochaetia bacterium]|nr:MAG: hypothetical protein A2Y41_01230 [Spirochaetes bacterium GWB1_36_13]HCL57441.1 hypothetical protein [Spirochaetia bacterium]
MIVYQHEIKESLVPSAGKGLFLKEKVRQGSVIVAPDKINRVLSEEELHRFHPESPEVHSSIRWFENFYTSTPEWTDECYINHSFEPNGLWHLGFVFAGRDIEAKEELLIDYRLILAEGYEIGFKDSLTGEPIIGLKWEEKLHRSTRTLLSLIQK